MHFSAFLVVFIVLVGANVIATPTRADYGPAVPRTQHQILGDYGEVVVARLPCPKCKHERTLRRLTVNFRCADVICDFCGVPCPG